MNKLKSFMMLSLAFVVGLLLSACSSSGDDEPTVSFKVLQTDLSMTEDGGTETFSVLSPTKPTATVTSGSDWCSVSYVDVSDNTYNYQVTAKANSEKSERIATIRVTAGTSVKDVTVTQAAKSTPVIPSVGMKHNAKELAALMYAGINIGNTMECPSGEGAWSGAKVNEAYIKGLKTAGFNAVRIPCAWDSYIKTKSGNYTIDATWLDRVYEVVSWCIANDMYVVLNAHWDNGWLEDNIFDSSQESSIIAEQKAIWTQVANKMKDFDEHLLFAACNEPGMNETSGGSKSWKNNSDAVARVVKYEQTMIDAVRATGGNNANRTVIIQGLGTDISNTNDYMTALPTDAVADRMMVEVHYYEPYQFCLMENDASWGKVFWYWGKDNHVDGSEHNATWGEEDWVKSQFAKMQTKYTSKGIPVIIGEYSASFRTVTENQAKHDASVAYYGQIVTEYAKNAGCVPFYWETGSVINRTTGAVKKQPVIDGIMKGAAAGKYPW